MSRLLITANSPGEMAGWVSPLVKEWKARNLGPVDILLLPCSFATGEEERVARSLAEVDRVYRPSEYFKLLWSEGRDYRSGHLLHLGGDLMYSAFLSWRWGIDSWSYLWARPWWDSAFKGYFTKDRRGVDWLKKRRVSEAKIHCTGDLVLDAVRQHVVVPSKTKSAQISYLPGSRREELKTLTPFFLELHRQLQAQHPELEGVLHLSPFLPMEEVGELLQSPPHPAVGGLQGTLQHGFLHFEGTRLRIAREDHYQSLSGSQLAISIPGTKTAEAGYLRTPLLTLLPLNRPEHLPSIGLLGLLDFFPGGRHLKGKILLSLKRKLGLLAHPNILAGRALLPEIVEEIEVHSLSRRVLEILENKKSLESVSETLENLYSWESRPAQALVQILLKR